MRRTRRSQLPIALIALLVFATSVRAATTIVPNPLTATLSYTKGSTTLPTAKVTIAPAGTAGSIYFTVNPLTLPAWLEVDKTNGTCSAAVPIALTFSPSLVAASSPAGMYSALVEIDSTGLTPVTVTVNLIVANAAPTVTATLAILPSAIWTPGTTIPTAVLTVKSSGDPVLFSVSAPAAAGATLGIILSAPSAVAYSWGTSINVTFTQSSFDNPSIGGLPLAGTIVVRAGNNPASNVAVSITVGASVATVLSISPPQLPQVITPATAVRTIAVKGSGFATGMPVLLGGAAGKAVVSGCGAAFATGTTDAWCLESSQQFFLRLSSGTLQGASATGNLLVLYLSAGAGGQFNIPVVTTPIVYAVTDAASFIQPVSPQFLNVAPYEMLSIFGDNFGAFSPALPAAVIGFTAGRLPPVAADASGNSLKVHFTDSTGSALMADSDGYLLLWTPTQINVLVPSTLPLSAGGQELNATVSVGAAASPGGNATIFNVVQASPAMLTFGGGQGVVVNLVDNSINSSTNPAKFGSTIVLYLSGMGLPMAGSAFAGNTVGPLAPGFAGCSTPASFLAALTIPAAHAAWVTFDGAVVDSTILGQYALPPCFDPSTVSVKIGNITLATAVAYAGFTADTIAGLYQVNVAVPLSNNASLATLTPPAAAAATPYSLQVLIGSGTSQLGVNVYLAK